MVTMTATEASRGFSALLDRIQRDGVEVTIVRDGSPVAVMRRATGSAAADLVARLATLPPLDPGDDLAGDLATIRGLPQPELTWLDA
jgi:antitoxin (DNA-binding transcriptional repressor) of toxin-antitoxin stability system